MPNRPANIKDVSSPEGLHVLNQLLREIQIRIDQTQKSIPLHKIVKGIVKLNFGAIGANSGVERSGYVAGATQQGSVHASPQLTLGNTSLIVASAFVSQANQVTVRLYNPTGSPITPNIVNWTLTIVQ